VCILYLNLTPFWPEDKDGDSFMNGARRKVKVCSAAITAIISQKIHGCDSPAITTFRLENWGPTRPRAEGGLQLVIVAFKNQRFHLQRDIQNANEHLTAKPVSDASK